MTPNIETRQAISALLDAGKTPTEIFRTLGCSRRLVYKVKNLKKAGQTLEHAYKKRKNPVLTPLLCAKIKRKMKSAPTKSMSSVADALSVNRFLVAKVVQEAGWRSLRRTKVPLVSAEGREKRSTRSVGLVNALKSARPGTIIFFFRRRPRLQPPE